MEPVSRATLLELKAKKDKWIKNTVELVYTYVINTAEEGKKSYRFVLIKGSLEGRTWCWSYHHLTEVISKLKGLFPDCDVYHLKTVMLKDGSYCDMRLAVATDLAPRWEEYIYEYIIVDWT